MSDYAFESRTFTEPVDPPLGLEEWAKETRRMLKEVYPDDIFLRALDSTEPGCRILHWVERALAHYDEIRREANR